MGLMYLLGDICNFFAFIFGLPATIIKTLAIYFYTGGMMNNEDNEE